MEQQESKKGTTFFSELSRRLSREEIETGPAENERLPLILDGQTVGVMNPHAGAYAPATFIFKRSN